MFRNRELRRFAALFVGIAAVATAVGFALHPAAGVLVLASAAAFGAVFWGVTRARYRRIAKLSEQIDRVLHQPGQLFISESDEGELSILQSEIAKMVLRIQEQNEALRREKNRLADSLADIAHQLRTPLTSANLTLSLLKNSAGEAERRALLRETEERFLQMDWLITSLLKLSRLDAGDCGFPRERVDVQDLIHTALRPFSIPMELHSIALRVDVPKGAVLVGR